MIFEVVTLFPEMFGSVVRRQPPRQGAGEGRARGLPHRSAQLHHRQAPLRRRHALRRRRRHGDARPIRSSPPSRPSSARAARRTRSCSRPTGAPLVQATVARLATLPRLMLVCGRYEGFDERVRAFVDEELSIGDYVLTGGELGRDGRRRRGARRLPGRARQRRLRRRRVVRGGPARASAVHAPGRVPRRRVPEALLSGNHARIARWRRLRVAPAHARAPPRSLRQLALSDRIARSSRAGRAAKRPSSRACTPSRSCTTRCTTSTRRSWPPRSPTSTSTTSRARAAPTASQGYFIVHPVAAQRELAQRIAGHCGRGGRREERLRRQAIDLLQVVPDLAAAVDALTDRHGRAPVVVRHGRARHRGQIGLVPATSPA